MTKTFAPNEAGRLIETLLKELEAARVALLKGDKAAAQVSVEYALHIADEDLQGSVIKSQLWPQISK